MAQPTNQEITDYITAVMDPDHLRTLQHKIEERLDALKAKRPIHERPQIDTPEASAPAKPTPLTPKSTPAAPAKK